MEPLSYHYAPKSTAVSYQESRLPCGHIDNKVHMHDHEELLLITSEAQCEIINNGNRLPLQTPAVVLHRAGTFHQIVRVSAGDFSSRMVFFRRELLEGLPEQLRHRQLFESDMLILELTQSELLGFSPLFDVLKTRSTQEQMLLLLLCLLSELAQLLGSGHRHLTAQNRQTYVFDVIDAIRSAETERITVLGLAERFHVSQSKLKSDFRKITGMTVKEFADHSRLQKATVLLESTDRTLADIAYECGFSGESHFIDTFRKSSGLTPGAFRRQHTK